MGESDSGCVSARGPRSGAPGDVHQVGNRHLVARRHRSRDGLIERERVPSMTRPANVRNDDLLAISNSWRVGLLPPELSQQNPRRVLQPSCDARAGLIRGPRRSGLDHAVGCTRCGRAQNKQNIDQLKECVMRPKPRRNPMTSLP